MKVGKKSFRNKLIPYEVVCLIHPKSMHADRQTDMQASKQASKQASRQIAKRTDLLHIMCFFKGQRSWDPPPAAVVALVLIPTNQKQKNT
ncbi:MAG: hypothetical protein Q7J10_09270 [Methanosarcinaceae archaeon]|nr:hypothetical protein [Methanosarcinaceae archaeon]